MKKYLFLLFMFPFLVFGQNNKIGIYYQFEDSLIKINPIKSSGYKANTLATALTMGIANSKMIVKYRDKNSKNKIKEPSFVFFFRPLIDAEDMVNYFNFTTSNRPDNFILVKLSSKGNKRELNWGKVNVYSGTDVGVLDKNIIPFESYAIDDFSYVVKPIDRLEDGEYAFIFDGANGSGVFMPIFDFALSY